MFPLKNNIKHYFYYDKASDAFRPYSCNRADCIHHSKQTINFHVSADRNALRRYKKFGLNLWMLTNTKNADSKQFKVFRKVLTAWLRRETKTRPGYVVQWVDTIEPHSTQMGGLDHLHAYVATDAPKDLIMAGAEFANRKITTTPWTNLDVCKLDPKGADYIYKEAKKDPQGHLGRNNGKLSWRTRKFYSLVMSTKKPQRDCYYAEMRRAHAWYQLKELVGGKQATKLTENLIEAYEILRLVATFSKKQAIYHLMFDFDESEIDWIDNYIRTILYPLRN